VALAKVMEMISPRSSEKVNESARSYFSTTQTLPRMPREGSIALTYRCNNKCRHCWLWENESSAFKQGELTFDDIVHIADEAQRMGCTHWSISGGEPLLRDDFLDIFSYLCSKSFSYSLNTNGTLITPTIAKAMKKKGMKILSLYGANAQIHDHITRQTGSFEALMRGCALLREAGAGFSIQVVPLRDNYHQIKEMSRLAESLAGRFRIGPSWLLLSARRDKRRNQEIRRQRLTPEEVNEIDVILPDNGRTICQEEALEKKERTGVPDLLFRDCILSTNRFHIDPYGQMSFCSTAKEPATRFSLRTFSFKEVWDNLLPKLALNYKVNNEFLQHCGSCHLRHYCSNCGARAWLETGRSNSASPYLCQIVRQRERVEKNWLTNHRRYFSLGGVSIQVDSELPFGKQTLSSQLSTFRIDQPGSDLITIYHHYHLPDLDILNDATLVYNKAPWEIYTTDSNWYYLAVRKGHKFREPSALAIFDQTHQHAHIFHKNDYLINNSYFSSLTALPSDHIFLGRTLADRHAVVLHSSGMIINQQGFLFVGPSGAGKSTIIKLLRKYGHVTCDDRNILRKWPSEYVLHSTWSHGEIDEVNNIQAPIKAIFLLQKAVHNSLTPLTKKREILHELILRTSRPLITAHWLDKTLELLADISNRIPVYQLNFTKDIRLLPVLEPVTGPLSQNSN